MKTPDDVAVAIMNEHFDHQDRFVYYTVGQTLKILDTRSLRDSISAAIAHARAETAVLLPKPMGYLVGGVEAIGFKAALDAIRALNPDVKFVEAEEKYEI